MRDYTNNLIGKLIHDVVMNKETKKFRTTPAFGIIHRQQMAPVNIAGDSIQSHVYERSISTHQTEAHIIYSLRTETFE